MEAKEHHERIATIDIYFDHKEGETVSYLTFFPRTSAVNNFKVIDIAGDAAMDAADAMYSLERLKWPEVDKIRFNCQAHKKFLRKKAQERAELWVKNIAKVADGGRIIEDPSKLWVFSDSQRKWLNTPIEHENSPQMSVRLANCLINFCECKIWADVCKIPKTDFMKYRNFGRAALVELERILQEMGLSFEMEGLK